MSLVLDVQRLALGHGVLVEKLRIEVPTGVVHTVMGGSGSGKSSLLAAVCGMLAPQFLLAASVWLNGRRIDGLPTEQRQVGILFQDDLLFAHMSVAQNLLFAVPPGQRAAREAAVNKALAELGLSGFAHANPATLSGGQRARVALMRALLAEPRALLLDEPFSRLDAPLRQRMRELVFAQVRERQIPALLVTHDLADVADPRHLTQLAANGPPA